MTSENDEEIKLCVAMLLATDANTGFMHESFHKDQPEKFTRSWFAWQIPCLVNWFLRLLETESYIF